MCAKLSAGACVDVTTAVVRGEARAGIAVVRPPGHHAESNTAMGFCFFNNAGIAARAAQVGLGWAWQGRCSVRTSGFCQPSFSLEQRFLDKSASRSRFPRRKPPLS